jgi:hypothetical protein
VGLVASVGVDGLGLGVTANASSSKSSSWSNSITHAETQVKGTSLVSMNSGGNMLLQGAQVSAATIRAIVAGDLTLISEQDSTTQKADMSSWSVSATVKSNSASVSGSYNEGKAAGSYLSVLEQTGFFAGTGGFDVKVGGTTSLTGAALASQAEATKNRLQTGAIRTADLVNASDWFAKSWGVSVGMKLGGLPIPGVSPSQKAGVSDQSTTVSAISPGTITVSDPAKQQLLTGQTGAVFLESLSRDTNTSHRPVATLPGLAEILDNQADLSKAQAAAMEAVTKTIGEPLAKLIGEAAKKGNIDATTQYILHAALGCGIGAIGGQCGSGAAGAVVGEFVGNQLTQAWVRDRLQDIKSNKLDAEQFNKDLEAFRAQAVNVSALTAAFAGAFAGGIGGAGVGALTGENAAQNNSTLALAIPAASPAGAGIVAACAASVVCPVVVAGVVGIAFLVGGVWYIMSSGSESTYKNEEAKPEEETACVPPKCSVEDIIKDAEVVKEGKPGKKDSTIVIKPGGSKSANEDFDNIGPTNVENKGNGIRTGQLQNGTTVTVRPNSSDGRPTLQVIGGPIEIKIRYK